MRYADYAGIMLLANFARYFKTGLTMEDFARLVAGRHSTRRFAPGELTQDEVVSILSAALQAPSSMNRRPWHFIVTDDKERLAALSRCKERGAAFVAGAAMAVVVCGDPLVSDVWIEDCSISAIMMQLAAEDLGIGSCWVQVRERQFADGVPADEMVRAVLGIPLQLQVLAIIAFGRKAVDAAVPARDIDWGRVHIDGF